MKIRNGFISNSSSSSFIIGIAKVIDKEAVEKIIHNSYDCSIIQIEYDNDNLVESFNYDQLRAPNVQIGDTIVIINHYGDEGDSYFDPDCTGDYDYDIDYDDCNSNIRKIIEELRASNSIEELQIAHGAGRNG